MTDAGIPGNICFFFKMTLKEKSQGIMPVLLDGRLYPHPWTAGFQWEITLGQNMSRWKSRTTFPISGITPFCMGHFIFNGKPVAIS
jgi:hypothetical protein